MTIIQIGQWYFSSHLMNISRSKPSLVGSLTDDDDDVDDDGIENDGLGGDVIPAIAAKYS